LPTAGPRLERIPRWAAMVFDALRAEAVSRFWRVARVQAAEPRGEAARALGWLGPAPGSGLAPDSGQPIVAGPGWLGYDGNR